MLTCKRCKYTNELLFVRVQSRMLSTFLLHLRFGFSWSLCVYTNYIYLLTYLSLYNPDPIWQNREKQELIYTSNKLLLNTLGKQLPLTTLVLSGFEGLLKIVGLEMMAEGVRAGRLLRLAHLLCSSILTGTMYKSGTVITEVVIYGVNWSVCCIKYVTEMITNSQNTAKQTSSSFCCSIACSSSHAYTKLSLCSSHMIQPSNLNA